MVKTIEDLKAEFKRQRLREKRLLEKAFNLEIYETLLLNDEQPETTWREKRGCET